MGKETDHFIGIPGNNSCASDSTLIDLIEIPAIIVVVVSFVSRLRKRSEQ